MGGPKTGLSAFQKAQQTEEANRIAHNAGVIGDDKRRQRMLRSTNVLLGPGGSLGTTNKPAPTLPVKAVI